MNRKHFHTFDALRFFAFLLVFLLHLPKTGNPYIDFFLKSGGIGVTFFFALSGFLITYILLFEKQKQNKLSLKNFFARRILRIWPLFYLMIAFAYLSPYILNALGLPYSNQGYQPDLLTSMIFGENYKMMATNTFPDGAPLRVMWTLCIEEHFYVLWGIVFYFASAKRIPLVIVLSILISNFTRVVYNYFDISHIDLFTHLDYFAFGAIPAYLLVYKQSAIDYIGTIPRYVKYGFFLLTVTVIFGIPNLDLGLMVHFIPTILGILFSALILFTLGKNPIHISDNLWISKLGTYTYGLYLYHTIAILFLIQVFKSLQFSNWYILGIVSLLITILVSMVSYHLYEKPFLTLKRYFSGKKV